METEYGRPPLTASQLPFPQAGTQNSHVISILTIPTLNCSILQSDFKKIPLKSDQIKRLCLYKHHEPLFTSLPPSYNLVTTSKPSIVSCVTKVSRGSKRLLGGQDLWGGLLGRPDKVKLT